jgi:hypothetical protein
VDALPAIRYFGDRDKALTLKSYALSHYNRVLNSMGNTLTANRTDKFGVGMVINCIINTDAYGNKTGMIRVFVPVIGGGGENLVHITYTDWKSPVIDGGSSTLTPPYTGGHRDRFVHVSKSLIMEEPPPLDPPNRAMDLPRFNPEVKTEFYGGQYYWHNALNTKCVSWYLGSFYRNGKHKNLFYYFDERCVACCEVGDKVIIIHYRRPTHLVKLSIYSIKDDAIVYTRDILSSPDDSWRMEGSFLDDHLTLNLMEYRGRLIKIKFSDDYTTNSIMYYGDINADYIPEQLFFSPTKSYVWYYNYYSDNPPLTPEPDPPTPTYTETRRVTNVDGSVTVYGYETNVLNYSLNYTQFNYSQKTIWKNGIIISDKKGFSEKTIKTYNNTYNIDNHVDQIIYNDAKKEISAAGVEGEWQRTSDTGDAPEDIDNSVVTETTSSFVLYPFFADKKTAVIRNEHVTSIVITHANGSAGSNTVTVDSNITFNDNIIFNSNFYIAPALKSAFDGNLLIFCFREYPANQGFSQSENTIIVNTKTKDIQYLDYCVDSIIYPDNGTQAIDESYPVSVTII